MSPQRVQSLRSSIKNQRPAAGTREPGELFVSFPDLQLGVINASKAAQDLIAVRFFSAATNYVAGDFVIQAGRGYRAKGPIVSGAFNPSDWETLSIIGESEPPIAAGTTADYWRGDKSWQILNKAAVGLSNVDNTSDANKPVSSAQQTALNLKANLASPTFTGTPAAPTPAYPNNSTALATTAFVSANFAPVMDPFLGGNPQATTPPISDNDTSIATTAYVKANLLSYAPIDSPVLTGDPKSVTPLPGDNDTSIATTAFVQATLAGKANVTHTHAQSDITNLTSDLALKAPLASPTFSGDARAETPATSDNDTSIATTAYVKANIALIPGATAQARNRIVNGAMQISQEHGDTSGTTVDRYGADQFTTQFVGTVVPTTQRVQSITPNGSANRYRVTVSTADAALAVGDYLAVSSVIEGVRTVDFRWGSASARQAVLRFGFKAPAGTYCVALINAGQARSYVANVVIAAGQANTDTEQVLVIPGDQIGTWGTGTGTGVRIWWTFAAGTTFQAPATGWNAGNFLAATGISNGMGTINNTFELFDVGLYLDPQNTGIAPPWQMPDEAEELRACQRYWQEHLSLIIGGYSAGSVGNYALSLLPCIMRVAPATTFSGSSLVNCNAMTVSGSHAHLLRVATTVTATGGYSCGAAAVMNARM